MIESKFVDVPVVFPMPCGMTFSFDEAFNALSAESLERNLALIISNKMSHPALVAQRDEIIKKIYMSKMYAKTKKIHYKEDEKGQKHYYIKVSRKTCERLQAIEKAIEKLEEEPLWRFGYDKE